MNASGYSTLIQQLFEGRIELDVEKFLTTMTTLGDNIKKELQHVKRDLKRFEKRSIRLLEPDGVRYIRNLFLGLSKCKMRLYGCFHEFFFTQPLTQKLIVSCLTHEMRPVEHRNQNVDRYDMYFRKLLDAINPLIKGLNLFRHVYPNIFEKNQSIIISFQNAFEISPTSRSYTGRMR